jgi:hypothetical protein
MSRAPKAPESRRIVVDTDVASSASLTNYPRSKACRLVLETILAVCHKVVLTPQQDAEWRNHRSRYTLGWLRQMAARGKWHRLPEEPNTGLVDRVDALPDDGTVDRVQMLKDVHLVEAAMATDGIVLSMDDKMFRRLNRHHAAIGLSKVVAWMNPEEPGEACCRWLERGALIAEARCLAPESED